MKFWANDSEAALDPNPCLQHFDNALIECGQNENQMPVAIFPNRVVDVLKGFQVLSCVSFELLY